MPPRSHHGPHVLGIKLSASSKAMRVYAQLYLSVMGALSVMGVYTLLKGKYVQEIAMLPHNIASCKLYQVSSCPRLVFPLGST